MVDQCMENIKAYKDECNNKIKSEIVAVKSKSVEASSELEANSDLFISFNGLKMVQFPKDVEVLKIYTSTTNPNDLKNFNNGDTFDILKQPFIIKKGDIFYFQIYKDKENTVIKFGANTGKYETGIHIFFYMLIKFSVQ